MTRRRGRPVLGAFSGFFLGLFVGIELLLRGVLALNSNVLPALPVAGLVLGILLGLWAPFRRRRKAAAEDLSATG